MNNNPLYRDTVTVIRMVRGEDDRGNETWTPTPVDVSGCNVQPMSSTEVIEGKAQVVTRWRLAGPKDLGLKASDRVQFDGRTFEVDGDPGVHRSFGGVLDHTEAILMEVTG
ncbi:MULTISPECIES: phage head completion protein [Streptomyces]